MIKKVLIIIAAVVVTIVVGGVAFIGPRNVIGIVRYGHTEEGVLKVGDRAPDVLLFDLDGKTQRHLLESGRSKPLVMVFGSFT